MPVREKLVLPEGHSWMRYKEYDEVNIPPPLAREPAGGGAAEVRVAISELEVKSPPVRANQNQPTAVPKRWRGAATVIQTRNP